MRITPTCLHKMTDKFINKTMEQILHIRDKLQIIGVYPGKIYHRKELY